MLPTARVTRSHLARSKYARSTVSAHPPSHSVAIPATARNISSRPTPARLNAAPAFKHRIETPHRPTTAALFSSREHEADCAALKDIFDAPSSSSCAPSRATSATPTGLFGSPSLPSPEAFVPLAQRTLVRAQLLVSRIVSAPQHGEGEMRRVVKNLDRLSDILCGVIDLAELVRNAHPDAQWRDAANQAYEGLCGFMNVLNTHTGLYEVLRSVLQDKSLRSSLSPEAYAVANVFLRDFEKSGIHLPNAQRESFVTLSDDILVLGRAFMQGDGNLDLDEGAPTDRNEPVRFKRQWFSSLNFNLLAALDESPALLKASTSSDICLDPALTSWEFPTILRFAPHPEARKIAYMAMNTSGKASIGVLERLLRKRAELANLTGYSSYAEMALGDKMAEKPESVDKFLRALESHHRPLALQKLEELKNLKRKHAADSSSSPASGDFEPWDRDFYAEHYLRALALSSPGSNVSISSFFSVGNVFSGLSRMLSALYGIRLRPAAMQAGEAWNDDVVKLQVVEEDSGTPGGQAIIGTVYADLFSRAGKPPSAAHYTVRCSRRIDDDDAVGDFTFGRLPDDSELSPEMGLPGGPASPLEAEGRRNPGREGTYQTPIVVLLCDFVRPTSSSGGPSLLGWTEVETLFHEMGHAIHSMIGRTEYHNVSGTRCATDFVELPSILMEHFISSPSVLSLVAHHHATGAPLPYAHLSKHLHQAKALDSLDTHNQILLALLDQRYHSERTSAPSFDSTREMYDLHERHGLMPLDSLKASLGGAAGGPASDLTWQGSFTHLFGYGATYYSYLFDRAIASRVWSELFAADPLSREAGERYKREVLMWGGGRDGWEMLSGLGLARRADGKDERLDMERVGEWGIETR